MNLIIKQNTSTIERVTSVLIDTLYNLTKPDVSTGEPAANAVLVGNLQAAAAYEDAVRFLNTHFSSSLDNGSDLQITVLDNNYYIRFEDPEVLRVLIDQGLGDGVGIQTNEVGAETLKTGLFKNNITVTSFNELEYFKTIGKSCFEGCTNLTSLDLREATKIGEDGLKNCSNLRYFQGDTTEPGVIRFKRSVDLSAAYALTNIPLATKLIFEKGSTIGNRSTNIKSLEEVYFPPEVMTIRREAFDGNSNMTGVYIEDLDIWLETVYDEYASNPLLDAHNLYLNNVLVTSWQAPEGTTMLKKGLWAGCWSLTSVDIDWTSILSIGARAFAHCKNLVINDLNLSSLLNFGTGWDPKGGVFREVKMSRISSLGSVTSIPTCGFQGCTALSYVELPSTLTNIGNNAFDGCALLPNISIPRAVTSIGSNAFNNCSTLSTVNITDLEAWIDITFGDANATPVRPNGHLVLNGTNVASYTFPSGTTSVKNVVFRNVSDLTTVSFPSSTVSIGDYAFNNCINLETVDNLTGITGLGKFCFAGCAKLEHLNGQGSTSGEVHLPNLISAGDAVFQGCNKIKTITSLGALTKIPNRMFNNCKGLTNVVIPNGITDIGDYAFLNAEMDTLTLPDSVTKLGYSTIYNIQRVTTIEIGSGLTDLGSNTFRDCSVSTIIMHAVNVPSGTPNWTGCRPQHIYVPPQSVDAYKAAPGWSNKQSIIEAIQNS